MQCSKNHLIFKRQCFPMKTATQGRVFTLAFCENALNVWRGFHTVLLHQWTSEGYETQKHMETGLTTTSSRHERLEKHLLMAALRVMEHEIGRLELRGRQKTHNMDTHQPYLHWFLCLSCQVTLTLCPPKDIRRRPLALANCWLCLP